MSQRTVCLIPGDGVGKEVIPAAAEVLRALMPDWRFTTADAGFECFQRSGNSIPDETLAAIAASDAAMFGATSSPSGKVAGYRSPILAMRRQFDLYANLRPTQSLPGAFARQGIDLLIVRENTEDLYVGLETREGDRAVAQRVITRGASERIARAAFEQARLRAKPRSRVTIVHKANVLKETDGLFRDAAHTVARAYPDVACDEMLVDAMAMRLVRDPESFDVIVTTNLYGDILSDEAAGLIGGLGVAPSANIGASRAIFEPVHGSAPDIAGKDIANPLGAILSAALLLDYLDEPDAARRVRAAVNKAVAAGVLTPDLGGSASTRDLRDAIIARLGA